MNKVKTYISKPVEVEAVQFIVGGEVPVTNFLGLTDEYRRNRDMYWENDNAIFEMFQPEVCSLKIKTLDGNVDVKNRDYVIRDRMGFYSVLREDLFLKQYYEK